VKTAVTPEGDRSVAPSETADDLTSFFDAVYLASGPGESGNSPVPHLACTARSHQRAQFPQLERVRGWMLRGEHCCTEFWCGLQQDGSLAQGLRRLSANRWRTADESLVLCYRLCVLIASWRADRTEVVEGSHPRSRRRSKTFLTAYNPSDLPGARSCRSSLTVYETRST
jgi:hypothetical protein